MDKVTFTINGNKCSVGNEVSSNTTLLDYIRKVLNLRGTKYMCKEAGCGACIVAFAKGEDCRPQGVNSCMVSIASCQNWNITTIENIGNRLKGYHPLQVTLANDNGSQCGYCSPGWVMAMYSLLKTKPRTMFEIENSLASNLCRCTGYRPILEAFKKFGIDAPEMNVRDIEDLKICKKDQFCDKNKYDKDWCLISKGDVPNKTIHIELCDHRDFYRVELLDEVFDIFDKKGVDCYMLIGGNTGKGVVPIIEYPKLLIDISCVWELRGHFIDQNLAVGGGTTLTEVMEIFEELSADDNFSYLKILKEHMEEVAHIAVRNIGTIAGNLMVKHAHPEFQSDIFVLLSTVGAQLTILHGLGLSAKVPMHRFLKLDMKGKIILNILLPPLNNQYKIRTFKVTRRAQNAHAFVNAGFLYKLKQKTNEVIDCRIAFGGISPTFSRAAKTENDLVGRVLFTNETLQSALEVLNKEIDNYIVPQPPNPSVEYRKQLALALFYKGLLSLCPKTTLGSRYASGAFDLHKTRPLSRGQQEFDTDPTVYPLNKPIPKLEGVLQCSGEAKYSEDVPTLPNEVYACFVLTTVPLGKIIKIDPSQALARRGVIAFYSAADIPGINSFTPVELKYLTRDEELLCNGEVKYFNQPLGIIVAETDEIAEIASHLVHVEYTNVKKPVIDIKIAKKDSTRVTLFNRQEPTKVGPDAQSIITGEKTIYGQYHFTMETLVCVSYPTEEGIRVHCASQFIDVVQQMTSKVLKIDTNRIVVVVRRVGGAYGVKITRATQSAVACNMVVHKLNRPCRFIQPLTTNMRAVGKRLPCSVDFEAAVDNRGRIQYMNYNLYSDNGYIVNEALVALTLDAYYNCYDRAPWRYAAYNVVTDTASNTWCRSPGTLETITITEMVMEQIAYVLGLDPLEVRLNNLDRVQHNAIQEMTDTLRERGDYGRRRENLNKFNKENRWKKRGLRFTFLKWTPVGPAYLDVNLSVYHEDGTVTITHSGVEIGQGINTKAIQIAAYFLKIPIQKIQINANDTVICPNGFATGGSITSQNVGIGVQKCCQELLTRLAPLRASLNNPTWEVLIKAAWNLDMDLQVHSFVNTVDNVQVYHIYGVTLSEVEIDVLTGQHEIIRVDLIEDVGRSVNPEIDIGQVEGAFTMGVGYWTCEELVYQPQTGELLTDRTWEYHIPQARDIPQDFRIYFRKGSFSTPAVLGAKATGEPATCMGVGVAIALREAITAARSDSGIPSTQWYEIDGPYTVEKISLYSATKKEQFKFY